LYLNSLSTQKNKIQSVRPETSPVCVIQLKVRPGKLSGRFFLFPQHKNHNGKADS
jgi:hypothetical protein